MDLEEVDTENQKALHVDDIKETNFIRRLDSLGSECHQ